MESQDNADNSSDEYHLKDSYPKMPAYRKEPAEVHLAESDVQDEEHKQRQYLVEQRSKEHRSTVQGRDKGKDKVRQNTGTYRHRQRPILYEPNNSTHLLAETGRVSPPVIRTHGCKGTKKD